MLIYPSLLEQYPDVLNELKNIPISYKKKALDKEINFNFNRVGVCFLKVERESRSFSVNNKLNFNEFYFYLYHSKINILVLKVIIIGNSKYYSCEAYDDLSEALKVYGVMIRPMGSFKTTKALKALLEKNITKIGIQKVLASNAPEHDDCSGENMDGDFKL